jgi:sulfoxide reductase catalytic subunit YedY
VVVPWKYGYKSPKSIVRIELTAERPPTFWNTAQPSEFGWYSNVDPGRDHPRWTQRTETDVGTGAMRPTLPYNGYAEVAELYAGGEF